MSIKFQFAGDTYETQEILGKCSVLEYVRKYGNEGNNDLPDGALAIRIDGVTYYGIGEPIPVESDERSIEHVEIPAGGEATITAFARLEEGELIVCRIDGEWYQFHSLEALASSQVNLEK